MQSETVLSSSKFEGDTAMSNTEGFAKGLIVTDYPGTGNGIPLLSSFYFRFEKAGSSQPVDNHINSILVLPGGLSEDLSPNAENSSTQVENEKIQLMFRDKDPDSAKDRYFYKAAHAILPTGSVRRFQIRDVGCTGKCERILPPPPSSGPVGVFGSMFVLAGFHLYFTGSRDHHIDKVGVFEDNGKLTVEFNDKPGDGPDPVFGYLVDYAWVKRRLNDNIRIGEESGSTTGGARLNLPPGQKVIRGFHFDFKSEDHHSREIGVLTANENLEVFYSDFNGDDPFRWTVRWASITPPVIGPVIG
jgi:hypothetical protein